MSNIHSLEVKMLIHKLDSVKKEMEFKNEKLNFINDLFMKEISVNDEPIIDEVIIVDESNTPVDENQINEEVNSGSTEQTKEETVKEILDSVKNKIELPTDIKKIYRKITTLTHPDKLENDDPLKSEKLKLYLEATVAANKNNIAAILLIGYKLPEFRHRSIRY